MEDDDVSKQMQTLAVAKFDGKIADRDTRQSDKSRLTSHNDLKGVTADNEEQYDYVGDFHMLMWRRLNLIHKDGECLGNEESYTLDKAPDYRTEEKGRSSRNKERNVIQDYEQKEDEIT